MLNGQGRCLLLNRCPNTAKSMGEAGSRVAEAREGDDAAVLVADAELSLSLERGACHGGRYVAGARRHGKQAFSRRV